MTASVTHREEKFEVNLLNSVRELQQQDCFCDAQITCADGGTVKVHRLLVAAVSPYFRQKFVEKYIEVNVLFGSDIIERLVKYCYSGEISICSKNCVDLLFAAEKFGMTAVVISTQNYVRENLSAVVQSPSFLRLEQPQVLKFIDSLPALYPKQKQDTQNGLLAWVNFDYLSRIDSYITVVRKFTEKYGPHDYCNIGNMQKAVACLSNKSLYCNTKYMVLNGRVYSYDGPDLQEISWSEVLVERVNPRCKFVVPLCWNSGMYFYAEKDDEKDKYCSLLSKLEGVPALQGEIEQITKNQFFVIDSLRRIRHLRADNHETLLSDTGRKVPDDVTTVHNVFEDEYHNMIVYGNSRSLGKRTLTYANSGDGGPQLQLLAAAKLAAALDIVHIPGTQVFYQVWSGHMEELRMNAHSLGATYNTIFLPRDHRVRFVLHPFCDKLGVVVLAQDVWSSQLRVFRYSDSKWQLLLQLQPEPKSK